MHVSFLLLLPAENRPVPPTLLLFFFFFFFSLSHTLNLTPGTSSLLQHVKMLRLVRGASFGPMTKRRAPLSRIPLYVSQFI